MSLLDEALEEFIVVRETETPDGYGGTVPVWEDEDPIQAAAVLDSSMQARVAEKQGVTALYTITTRKAVTLRFHDVLRRTSDGKIFRVTSNGNDKKTPGSAWLDMRQVSAEEWRLPDG